MPLAHQSLLNPVNSLHLARIQRMKSISKPRVLIEIHNFQEIMSTHEEEFNGIRGFLEGDSYYP
jgi:hypothetical protein